MGSIMLPLVHSGKGGEGLMDAVSKEGRFWARSDSARMARAPTSFIMGWTPRGGLLLRAHRGHPYRDAHGSTTPPALAQSPSRFPGRWTRSRTRARESSAG